MRKLINKLLFKYVDWERMRYTPKINWRPKDKVRLNWKGRIFGYETSHRNLTIKDIWSM